VLAHHPGHQLKIPGIAFNQMCLRGDSPTVSRVEIVDDHYIAAGIDKLSARMGTDIAGSSGDEHIPAG
jgi:hypothetical protein